MMPNSPAADDVAVVYITTHGTVLPTYSGGDIEYLEGTLLLNGLDGIDIRKLNAVSPGICNFLENEDAPHFATPLGIMFGYVINPDIGPPNIASESEMGILHRVSDEERAKDIEILDVYNDFDLTASTVMHIYRGIDNTTRGSPVSMETDEYIRSRKQYDVDTHPYTLYKMSSDTPIFNKQFSVSKTEYDSASPYDWNITMFDSSGPRSLIQEMFTKGNLTIDDDPVNPECLTSTVDIASYLHSIGKRRLMMVDMSCSVAQSASGASCVDLSRIDTGGRCALRALREVPHG
jgi:hypothetical protein